MDRLPNRSRVLIYIPSHALTGDKTPLSHHHLFFFTKLNIVHSNHISIEEDPIKLQVSNQPTRQWPST